MSSELLLQDRAAKVNAESPADVQVIRKMAVMAGSALALIGWTDVLLLWFPMDFGNPEWEFVTAAGTFDALPLGTIGLLLVAAGGIAREWVWRLRVLAAACVLVLIALLCAYGLYGLSAVVAWRAVDGGVRWVLVKAVAKTSVLAVVYFGLYAWLGWVSGRAATSRKGRRR